MVERSLYIDNVGLLKADLQQATTKIEALQKKEPQSISPQDEQEMKELIQVLHKLNENIAPGALEEKKFVLEEMDESIRNALEAIDLFNVNQPAANKTAQKNIRETIVSLFASLSSEIKTFNKNLKDLKKHRIGQKVVETQKSKQS